MIETLKEVREALNLATTPLARDRQEVLQAINKLDALIAATEKAEPVGTLVRGEICTKSKDDDQSFGMWCPVDLPEGTKLYTAPQSAPSTSPLTDEQIQKAITKAVSDGALSWLGFNKDDQGKYNIPMLSPCHYQLARTIEAAHGIGAKP